MCSLERATWCPFLRSIRLYLGEGRGRDGVGASVGGGGGGVGSGGGRGDRCGGPGGGGGREGEAGEGGVRVKLSPRCLVQPVGPEDPAVTPPGPCNRLQSLLF